MGTRSQSNETLSQRFIFTPKAELLNLGLPIVFLLWIAFGGGYGDWGKDDRLLLRYLQAYVFANGYHVMFSYWNLRYLDEFKQINTALKIAAPKLILGFLALLGFFLMSHDYGYYKSIYPLRVIAVLTLCIAPALHRNRQSMGLSLLYNMNEKSRLSPSAVASFSVLEARNRKWEHRAANLLLFSGAINALSMCSGDLPFINRQVALQIGAVVFAAGVSCLVYAIWQFRAYRHLAQIKTIFNLRQLIQAFIPISPVALMSTAAVHGTEYTILQAHMIKKSRSFSRLKISAFVALGLLLVFEMAMDSHGLLRRFQVVNDNQILKGLIVFSATLTYFHYVLDSIYFRLSNPVVRAQILPLLKPGSGVSTAATPVQSDHAA